MKTITGAFILATCYLPACGDAGIYITSTRDPLRSVRMTIFHNNETAIPERGAGHAMVPMSEKIPVDKFSLLLSGIDPMQKIHITDTIEIGEPLTVMPGVPFPLPVWSEDTQQTEYIDPFDVTYTILSSGRDDVTIEMKVHRWCETCDFVDDTWIIYYEFHINQIDTSQEWPTLVAWWNEVMQHPCETTAWRRVAGNIPTSEMLFCGGGDHDD